MKSSRLIATLMLLWGSGSLAQESSEYIPPAKRVSPQDGLVAQMVPKGVTPRLPDGKVDFNGTWGMDARWDSPYVAFSPRNLEVFEPDQVAMQRANHWNKPHYKPELWQKIFDTDFSKIVDDPAFHCMPPGTPRSGPPFKIVQTANEILLINVSYGATTRHIPLDGRPLTAIDEDYTNYNGVSSARWDGDTLVIDSVGFTDETWLQWTGYIHSSYMKLTERLTRKGDLLYYSFVVNDPEVLVEPWQSETFVKRLHPNPKVRFEEVPPCKEQDADQVDQDPYYRG